MSTADGGTVVRLAAPEDVQQIAAIERASFADPWTADALASAMALDHIHFLVAEAGGGADIRITGYVVALVMGDEGEIADVAVEAAARGRGVGTLLLAQVEQDLARRGVRTLYLEVRESNRAALGLYQRRGFEAVGRRRAYYRRPMEDALVLRREIEPR